jgi:hypothetical protein
MTAQPQEIGHVLGWTVVLAPESHFEEHLEISTIDGWEAANRLIESRDCQGYPLGAQFFTRIHGPSGVSESFGASPKVPLGIKMIFLPCSHCGQGYWFVYRPEAIQTHCTCAECNRS